MTGWQAACFSLRLSSCYSCYFLTFKLYCHLENPDLAPPPSSTSGKEWLLASLLIWPTCHHPSIPLMAIEWRLSLSTSSKAGAEKTGGQERWTGRNFLSFLRWVSPSASTFWALVLLSSPSCRVREVKVGKSSHLSPIDLREKREGLEREGLTEGGGEVVPF